MKRKNPYILLAEDHEDTCELLTLVLSQENYEVWTSPSVSGALDLAKAQRFDTIILDSHLIDGSGLELCRIIRENDRLTPILFYSALAYEKDKQAAFGAGAQSYLVKPVNASLLFETLAKLLADSRGSVSPLVLSMAARKDSGELSPPISV
jgi:DNA-binding response OmpR family regulator